MPLLGFVGNIVASKTTSKVCRLATKTKLAAQKSADYAGIFFTEKRLSKAQTAQKITQRATYAANLIQEQTKNVADGDYVKQEVVLDQARDNVIAVPQESIYKDDTKPYEIIPEQPQSMNVWVDANDLYKHANNHYPDLIEESLAALISNNSNTKETRYQHLHNRTAMRTFRSMIKDMSTEKNSDPRYKCAPIIKLINKLPIHELYQEQILNIFTKKNRINQDLFVATNPVIKFQELLSNSKKEQRHSNEFKQLNNIIRDTLRNLDKPQNFESLLRLCASPAFQYAILHQPSLGFAVQQLFKQDKGCQKNFGQFRINKSANIRAYNKGIKSKDEDINTLISGYNFFKNIDALDILDKTLAAGAHKHYKHMHLSVAKRKIAQGLIPALAIGSFAASTVIPATATAIKASIGVAVTLGSLGALIASHIHIKRYWQEHPEQDKNNIDSPNTLKAKMNRFAVRSIITSIDAAACIAGAVSMSAGALFAKAGLVSLAGTPPVAGTIGGLALATSVAVPLLVMLLLAKNYRKIYKIGR